MGKACALRLSEAGFTVFAAVRKERDAQDLRDSGSRRLIPIILDVTKDQTISEAFGTIRDAVGAAGLAGLVNNAGIAVTGPIELIPMEDLRRQFEINVFGQVAVTQAFLPLIRAARGRIIHVGSVGPKSRLLPFLFTTLPAGVADTLRLRLFGVYRPFGAAGHG